MTLTLRATQCDKCTNLGTHELRTQFGVWGGLFCLPCGEKEGRALEAYEVQHTRTGHWLSQEPMERRGGAIQKLSRSTRG